MIFILTGEVRSGKTALLKRIVGELEIRRLKPEGFLSERITAGEQTTGYDLFNVKTRTRIPFLRRSGRAAWQKIGPYHILPAGLNEAEALIARSGRLGLLVVDEIGPLELEGKGLWPSLHPVLADPGRHCLLVVRTGALEPFLKKLGRAPVEIFEAGACDLAGIVDAIKSHVR